MTASPSSERRPLGAVAPSGPAPSSGEQRAALVRLLVVVVAGLLAAVVTGTTKTVAVMLAIVAMIMLHELGHFLTAKWADMKVTEYFLGFGPRLWSVRRGETEYGVKAIPAGGYVKIIGMSNLEEVDAADEARAYRSKPYWRRLSVGVAGSAMHFLIAFALLWALNGVTGTVRPNAPIEVGSVSRLATGQSPAERAGLQVGDRLISYDGRPVENWEDVRSYIQAHPNSPVRFTVERDGRRLELVATPVDLSTLGGQVPDGVALPDRPTGFLGVAPRAAAEKAGPITALGRAAQDLGNYSVLTVKALGGIFSFDGVRSYADQLSGSGPTTPSEGETRFLSPVGLTRIAGEAADAGIAPVLFLLASINIFVGIFNLIPLLPLDGGHVAIATYERLRSRRGRPYHADVAKLMPVTYAVFLLLVFVGLTSLYLDIARPLNLQ